MPFSDKITKKLFYYNTPTHQARSIPQGCAEKAPRPQGTYYVGWQDRGKEQVNYKTVCYAHERRIRADE